MTKYAIIIQTTEDATIFRSTYGFYNKHLHDLQQAGYEILKINVNEISTQLANLPPSSVGFLWIRMHGSPQSMTATKELKITLENCYEIFKSLPTILIHDACVFLDSCSTGYLLPDFNNMQFAFAKLTLEKPLVQIVAPSKDMHVFYFCIQDDGSFYFEMQESSRSNKNMAVVLGRETKGILSDAIQHNDSLESRAEAIRSSLQIREECPFLNDFKKEQHGNLCGASFDLTNVLLNAIIYNANNAKAALVEVKRLIEVFHAIPNYEEGYVLTGDFKCTAPLAAAISNNQVDVVTYLLNHGADLFHSFKGETIHGFASHIDYMKIKEYDVQYEDLAIWFPGMGEKFIKEKIVELKKKNMNEHVRMVDVIAEFSKNQSQKKGLFNNCLWNLDNEKSNMTKEEIKISDKHHTI